MAFSSIFVPNFMLQAVMRAEPKLRECALVLTDGSSLSRSIVAANEKAIGQGIRLGMPERNGIPVAGLELRARSPLLEETAHAALLDVGWSVSPRIEDSAPDTIILDLSGLTYLFSSEKAIAGHLASRCRESGLMSQVAIASNADAALVAARGFRGVTVIESGKESEFLACLPASVLSPPEEIAEALDRWGIYTCGDLARLPVLDLSERFGQEGVRLYTLARGVAVRDLLIAEPEYSFTETMELDDSVEELEPLSFLLGRLLDQLCLRLKSRSLAAAVLHVRFELEPSPEKPFDPRKELFRLKNIPMIYATEIQFPVPICNSKVLLKLLRLHLQAKSPSAPICKIVLTAESARPRTLQGDFFIPSSPDSEKLEVTIARIANLVGQGNVGSPALQDTHQPDAFLMDRFRALQNAAEEQGSINIPRQCKSFLIYRPPIPIAIQMQAGLPVSIVFQGQRGKVKSASGPWRSSGNWWEEHRWDRGEWDVEIHFPAQERNPHKSSNSYPQDGMYRIYQDLLLGDKWFVEGIYD